MPKSRAANGAGPKASGSSPQAEGEEGAGATASGSTGRGSSSLLFLLLGLLLGVAGCAGLALALEPRQVGEALGALGVELPRPPPQACPSCPKCKACKDCPPVPKCPAPTGGSCGEQLSELRAQLEASGLEKAQQCQEELAKLKGDLEECGLEKAGGQEKLAKREADAEDLAGKLAEAQAALGVEREALWASCNRTVEEAAAEAAEAARQACAGTPTLMAEEATSEHALGREEEASEAPASSAWPNCVEQGTVLRGKGVYAGFEDVAAVLGTAAKGCWEGDCSRTDKFEASAPEDCARVCAVMTRCAFWTWGEQDGTSLCFLRTSDAGREQASGFMAAARDCSPPATEVAPVQAALAVLDSAALRACDGGAVGDACPDLHDAMRTWNYGIQNLRTSLEGTSHGVGGYLDQIATDAESFIGLPSSDQLPEFYAISAANNRQVFEAVRGFLTEQAAALPSVLDASVPRPARGLLCKGDCLA